MLPPTLLLLSFLLLAAAVGLALQARRGQERSGLPKGRLVYADTSTWSEVSRPYVSSRYHLTGKPDYLVDTPRGLVPVEVKNSIAPSSGQAYDAHILQLAAYCLLVEDADGLAPSHGLIHYADATLRIDYTPQLRDYLLAVVEEMRQQRKQSAVLRSHRVPARCQRCGLRHACGDQALA